MEGNVRSRRAVHHDWSPPVRPSLAVKKSGEYSEIESFGDEHFYVTFKRQDRRFSVRPDSSSFQFEPGQAIHLSVDALVADGMDIAYVVVEYTDEARRTFTYTSPEFVHPASSDAVLMTLAVRAKGRGRLALGTVSTRAYDQASEWQCTKPIRPGATASLSILSFTVDRVAAGAVLVGATFRDAAGELTLPLGDSPINPRIGAYKYVDYGSLSDARETIFELQAPDDAASVTFTIMQWKPGNVYLVQEPVATIDGHNKADEQPLESLEDFVQSIPAEETLIVLYTTAPQLGHPTLALRPNRMTKEYLKLGCWVVFFPFSRVPLGEEVQGAKVRQYSRDHIGAFLSAASARRGNNNIFICSSFPDVTAAGAIDLLGLSDWRTVYEVRDDMEEFNRVGYSKWFHPQLETRVANRVDKVITVSPRLAGKMDVLRRGPGHASVVPNAVDEDFVERTEANRSRRSYGERSSSLTVGYIGHLTSSWFDWALVIATAEQMSNVKFEIIGHGLPAGLVLPPNVRYLGAKTHDEFQEIALNWKVGLIPFKASTLTSAVDPNKVYEYLAVGLRTVTARMGSVHLCPSTWIYDDAKGFREALTAALETPFSRQEEETIEEFLGSATWSARAKSMLQLIRKIDV